MDNEIKGMLVQILESQTEMKQDMAEMKQDMAGMKKDINSLYAKIEGDISDHIKALQDGYKQNYEMITDIKDMVIKNTEDINDINISLSGMKEDINFIASKTIRNDIKIDKINEKLKIVR